MECRRRYERVAFFCPLEVTALSSGQTVPGTSFDITVAGVGLTSGVLLERGETVRLRFHLRNGSHNQTNEDILGRVAYANADEDGNRLGVEFLELVNDTTHPALAHALAKL
jgi:hypothetical protein